MIACIRIPYFAATVARQADADVTDAPLILAHYSGRRGKVYAVCPLGEAAGVQVGMALSRAHALCPEAHNVMANPARVQRTLENLLLLLSDYSQWIEFQQRSAQTAILYVDLGKLIAGDGQALAEQIMTRLTEKGYKSAIGLAANKFTAYAAAHCSRAGEIILVKRGDEAAYLAPLPVGVVRLDKETTRRLESFGLRSLGQIVRYERAALVTQFGKTGARLHRLASGEDTQPVARYAPPVVKMATRQFEPPVDDRMVLESVLRVLAGQFGQQLQQDNQTCSELSLLLRLADRRECEVRSVLRQSISGSLELYRHLQKLLSDLKVTCPVVEVQVQIGQLAALVPHQLSLFDQPAKADPMPVLAELSKRFGESCFYTVNLDAQLSLPPEFNVRLEPVAA